MVTIKDVAKRARVSTATVSRVLNDDPKVSPENRRAVQEAVTDLNYRRDRIARNLRVKGSQIIGLIISDIQNPFFTSVVRGVEDVAYENGYTLLLCNSDEDRTKEKLYLEAMISERTAGVIVSPAFETGSHTQAVLRAGIPVVATDRRMLDQDVDTVVVDNLEGAYQAVSHLANLGHNRIGFIGGPPQVTTARERRDGYLRALSEHGIELDHDLIMTSDLKLSGGYKATCQVLAINKPPSAIFAANNLTTLGALNCIHEKKLAIPGDIALVGFDDMPWATSLNPPLTAVAQPTYEMGRTAAELLIKRIGEKDRDTVEIKLKSRLIIRDSCGYTKLNERNAARL
ncbi:MAG: LacI family DNA-binding transcriptional regulator [Anaerolineales bacterium]|nr:LacI family DNA-binding transcriptional regulator [Anaerolineales bacterium]